jgi:hypothetical protein
MHGTGPEVLKSWPSLEPAEIEICILSFTDIQANGDTGKRRVG